MAQKTNLPLGAPTFRKIRQGNFIYADKTRYIYDFLEANPCDCCFLSRPRRFGKTLLLDTMEELFQGDRELFRGLWIDKSRYKFERHPVLRFNMAYAKIRTEDDLIFRIMDDLNSFASKHDVTFTSKFYDKMIEQLLEGIFNKHGARAVILVDEYDAPVTDHILDEDLAKANRTVLHDFYRAIKNNMRHVHFAFVTGITRFAMTAMDSGPNSFMDISLMPKFAGICGFTTSELNKLFRGRFSSAIRELKKDGKLEPGDGSAELVKIILEYYDGYNWLGPDDILNPFSIVHFFANNRLGSYWPSSGRPTHLISLARKNPADFL
ncbi:MAG: AAA family ATPase, partial [Deltaproteobacteria bacterium]|nr:AAA family ATPase [Deltaproteobacteria bacterium]